MTEISYEIQKELGVLSQTDAGWTKEVNLIRWNGNPEKVDIRSWSPDHVKMTKGITLTRSEAEGLKDILNSFL